jgi:S1-C subfamily serine protease
VSRARRPRTPGAAAASRASGRTVPGARTAATVVVAAVVTALFAAGCVAGPTAAERHAATTTSIDLDASGPPELVGESLERHTREVTVRVRNIGCYALATGSGIAIGPDVFVTNQHVTEGARELQVTTWDGRSLAVSVSAVSVSNDLSVVRVDGRLPAVAEVVAAVPQPGDRVTAVGYPGGGEITMSAGRVVDLVDGEAFGERGRVIRATSTVRPGNSGGPLLDGEGRVVGVVYAYERSTGYALAIPAATLLRERGRTAPLALDDCRR